MKVNRKVRSFFGYALFFTIVAVVVTVSMLCFAWLYTGTNGNMTIVSLLMFLVVIALSVFCTVVFTISRKNFVDEPLEEILSATKKIASGDFSIKLMPNAPYDRYFELNVIKENLNMMSAELGRKEMLSSDFISNVSHEIKTPLTVIQNYVKVLSNNNLDAESRRKYIETISNATTRLSQLVSNILKLSKLENQEIATELEKFRLDNLVAECVIGFEDLIEKNQLELNCDFDEIEIYSEPSYLELVCNNLISNAIKFTNFGGKVEISLKKQGDKAIIKVADNGIGISKLDGEHIFDKFYQADRSRLSEGNGLGLAMVKKVVDILGGQITVQSEINKGSTFTIVLSGVMN